MRKATLAMVTMALVIGAAAAAEQAMSAEQAAVVRVVTEAYVDGIHNYRNVEAVRKGFHPGFEMLSIKDGALDKFPIGEWIARLEARNQKDGAVPADAPRTIEATFPLVDVTGDVATCKIELRREGKLIFTDYMLLYRYPDGWKIVSKAYQRH